MGNVPQRAVAVHEAEAAMQRAMALLEADTEAGNVDLAAPPSQSSGPVNDAPVPRAASASLNMLSDIPGSASEHQGSKLLADITSLLAQADTYIQAAGSAGSGDDAMVPSR